MRLAHFWWQVRVRVSTGPFDFGVLSKLPLQRRSESFTIGRSAFPIFLAIQARIVAKDYPSGEQV